MLRIFLLLLTATLFWPSSISSEGYASFYIRNIEEPILIQPNGTKIFMGLEGKTWIEESKDEQFIK